MTAQEQAYRLVRPTGAEARRGIVCLIGGPEGPEVSPDDAAARDHALAAQVAQFETYAAGLGISADRQVMAYAGPRVRATCLWVPSPGRTAMLFAPSMLEFPAAAPAGEACIVAALADAAAEGVVLVQAMLEPHDELGARTLTRAGLTRLATLVYMERQPAAAAPTMQLPEGYRLEAYSAATHAAFRQAVLDSYQQTLDCPALTGLRDVEDVIAGHKAVGKFDPELWSVVLEADRPVGCLLLAQVPARNGLDLVYLGLAPRARRRGIGRALMRRMLGVASARGVTVLTLAVDEGNEPALRMYHRFGFTPVARRVAMIRKLTAGSNVTG